MLCDSALVAYDCLNRNKVSAFHPINIRNSIRDERAKRYDLFSGSPRQGFGAAIDATYRSYQGFHLLNYNSNSVGWIKFTFEYFSDCDELSFSFVWIRSVFVLKEFRGNGYGERTLRNVCQIADEAGCNIFLVASAFEQSTFDLTDVRRVIDLHEDSVGFSQPHAKNEIVCSSERLQKWYIERFGFGRMNNICGTWGNNYFRDNAFLCRKSISCSALAAEFIETNKK